MRKQLCLEKAVHIQKTVSERRETMQDARTSERYFTRNRKMSFQELLLYQLNMPKCAAQTGLNRFWHTVRKNGEPMSQQAFSKARDHYDHSPFEKIFRAVVEAQYSGEYEYETWNGLLVLSIDGTRISLPSTDVLRATFGVTGRNATAASALGSVLYDVTNDIIVDAIIGRNRDTEREMAKLHLKQMEKLALTRRCVVLFDRGYPSLELIRAIPKGMRYVMRASRNWRKEVNAVKASDSMVPLDADCTVRVLKFSLPSGEEETMITNMFDRPEACFAELYFMRWPIETKFDVVKNKLELENFTGRTVNSILQDFWAAMHMTNMVALAKRDARESVQAQRKDKDNKYTYVPNTSQLIGALKDKLVVACLASSSKKRCRALDRIAAEISRAVVPLRPGRSSPRNPYPREVKFHHNHKSNC
jgi:hypothetical protein